MTLEMVRLAATHRVPRSPRARRRGQAELITRVLIGVLDLTLILLATFAAAWGRSRLGAVPYFEVAHELEQYARTAAPQIILLWVLLLWAFRSNTTGNTGVGTEEYQRVIVATGTTAGLVGIACFLTQFPLSRGFFILLFAIGLPLLVLGRMVLRRVLHRAREAGRMQTRVIVAGSQRNVDDIAKVLARESWLGKEVIGAVVPRTADIEATPAGYPVLGHTDTVVDTVLEHGAESVVFAQGSFPTSNDFRRMAWELEKHHVNMIVVPALSDVSKGRINVRPVAGLPLVYVEPSQRAVSARFSKRVFDIVGGSLILLLLSPVMLAIALWVKLHDRGPVLYRQMRVGKDGRLFGCLKFRSMVPDADRMLADLVDRNESDDILFKMRQDPRITRPGRVIRRYSLDELPQIVNVIRGEMSLVGPRPPIPTEVERYHPDVLRRLRVRPGMTGLWQVSGRSELSWEETVRLDLYYVDNWTMTQDLQILMRTFQAVFGGRGAY